MTHVPFCAFLFWRKSLSLSLSLTPSSLALPSLFLRFLYSLVSLSSPTPASPEQTSRYASLLGVREIYIHMCVCAPVPPCVSVCLCVCVCVGGCACACVGKKRKKEKEKKEKKGRAVAEGEEQRNEEFVDVVSTV
jgi:hypothetical protein